LLTHSVDALGCAMCRADVLAGKPVDGKKQDANDDDSDDDSDSDDEDEDVNKPAAAVPPKRSSRKRLKVDVPAADAPPPAGLVSSVMQLGRRMIGK
jgi:hypothetical protein